MDAAVCVRVAILLFLTTTALASCPDGVANTLLIRPGGLLTDTHWTNLSSFEEKEREKKRTWGKNKTMHWYHTVFYLPKHSTLFVLFCFVYLFCFILFCFVLLLGCRVVWVGPECLGQAVGSPSAIRAPNGRLLVSHDFFGASTFNDTVHGNFLLLWARSSC